MPRQRPDDLQRGPDGVERVVYESALDLLQKTPNFVDSVLQQRLDGCFDSVYRFAEDHFGGCNLYMEAVRANQRRLQMALSSRAAAAPSGELQLFVT